MKLVIITSVEEFQKDVLALFKKANIEAFSSVDIDGYKNAPTLLKASSWFAGENSGSESCLFFTFTEDDTIEALFNLIRAYNLKLKTNNPIKAVVVPIEKYL